MHIIHRILATDIKISGSFVRLYLVTVRTQLWQSCTFCKFSAEYSLLLQFVQKVSEYIKN